MILLTTEIATGTRVVCIVRRLPACRAAGRAGRSAAYHFIICVIGYLEFSNGPSVKNRDESETKVSALAFDCGSDREGKNGSCGFRWPRERGLLEMCRWSQKGKRTSRSVLFAIFKTQLLSHVSRLWCHRVVLTKTRSDLGEDDVTQSSMFFKLPQNYHRITTE